MHTVLSNPSFSPKALVRQGLRLDGKEKKLGVAKSHISMKSMTYKTPVAIQLK